jgi:hypothetical protein
MATSNRSINFLCLNPKVQVFLTGRVTAVSMSLFAIFGGGAMVVRRTISQTPRVTRIVTVGDPELDMRRGSAVPAGRFERLREMLGKLTTKGRRTVSPMRSIGRELEESWPGGEF